MEKSKHTLMNKCYDINIRALVKKNEQIKKIKALNFYTSEQNLFNIGGGINDIQERQRQRKVSPCTLPFIALRWECDQLDHLFGFIRVSHTQ